ncbi:MAG: hypothetical protein BAJALOKI1v1_630007 [Promethearchaeota archaeon]|nr:MAG: hypothetical protein BAJALOKI1v1_630007 [Candidatus Lokiarchaeota archaeon]
MESIKIIKKMPEIHCARGPKWCEKCREAIKNIDFCLIKVYLKPGNVARPMTEVYVGCRRIYGEYDVIKRFASKKDAKQYAIDHGIDISFE